MMYRMVVQCIFYVFITLVVVLVRKKETWTRKINKTEKYIRCAHENVEKPKTDKAWNHNSHRLSDTTFKTIFFDIEMLVTLSFFYFGILLTSSILHTKSSLLWTTKNCVQVKTFLRQVSLLLCFAFHPGNFIRFYCSIDFFLWMWVINDY